MNNAKANEHPVNAKEERTYPDGIYMEWYDMKSFGYARSRKTYLLNRIGMKDTSLYVRVDGHPCRFTVTYSITGFDKMHEGIQKHLRFCGADDDVS